MPIATRTRYVPALLGLLVFWAVALPYLGVVPTVYEDEPWQASTARKLADEGVFGSDLFAGYYGMEQHYYVFMPAYPMALALLFRVTDVGLWQARFFSVMCGALILALTYTLTLELWHDWRRSSLAIFFLVAIRWFAETPLHPTGILFLDAVRVARYDALVPVLALTSVYVFIVAQKTTRGARYFAAGLLAGLAGLAHLYGLFLLPVLVVLTAWNRARHWARHIVLIAVGAFVIWLPYGIYVLSDLPEWRAQSRGYAPRFDVLNPGWYWENLTREPVRYALGLSAGVPLAQRAGVWFIVLMLPMGIWMLAQRAWVEKDTRARMILVPVVVLPLAFAILLTVKFTNYLLLIAPFGAILLGWTMVTFFEQARGHAQGKWLTLALAFFLAALTVETTTRVAHLAALAAVTTPYIEWSARLYRLVPRGARVLGLPKYGFVGDMYVYRALNVPLALSNPQVDPNPIPLATALDAQQPDYVLMDDALREYLAENEMGDGARFAEWLETRRAALVGSIQDTSYGLVEVWKIGQ